MRRGLANSGPGEFATSQEEHPTPRQHDGVPRELHGGPRIAGTEHSSRTPDRGPNRACQRHTVGFDCPVRAMISIVPTPSPVNSTISGRRACFCAVFRSATSLSRRTRSAGKIWIVIPVLISSDSHNGRSLGILSLGQNTSVPASTANIGS